MNQYDPHIHHRRSIRLKGYDYSQEGLYFITLCVQDRLCLFGEIVGASLRGCPNDTNGINNDILNGSKTNIDNSNSGKMIFNDAGRMIEKWYCELENKYPDKRCHEMVVMPNHIHFIIENVRSSDAHVRSSDAHVRSSDAHVPSSDAHVDASWDAHVGAPLRGRPNNDVVPQNNGSPYGIHNKKYNATIGDAMDWFKTMTTNEYIRNVKRDAVGVVLHGNPNNWPRFNGKLWQRNYYEHIIRDEQSYERIVNYIINNPAKWNDDKFHN